MRLHPLRRILSLAAGEMFAGRTGQLLRARLGVVGTMRSNEQTWGQQNGWHPHRHEVWLLEKPFAELAPELVHEVKARWVLCVENAFKRMWRSIQRARGELYTSRGKQVPPTKEAAAQLWGARVLKGRSLAEAADYWEKELLTLGSVQRITPDLPHGLRLDCVQHLKTYLTKLGLELTSSTTKTETDAGHFTHWMVYRQAVDQKVTVAEREQSRALVREHYEAMRGSALLVFSRGLRKLVGLQPEIKDADIPQEQARPTEDTRYLFEIEGTFWDAASKTARQDYLAELYLQHANGTLSPANPQRTQSMYNPVIPTPAPVRPVYWERWSDPDPSIRPPRLPESHQTRRKRLVGNVTLARVELKEKLRQCGVNNEDSARR